MIDAVGGRPISARPIVIGVTGNIACGKSTVMQMLGELGTELIDADAVYHELIAPGRPLWQELLDRFGNPIRAGNGTIDRQALGGIVFSDPTALADLDRITHPAVVEAIRDRIDMSNASVVAVDAVKLIEGGMAPLCNAVWLVRCDRDRQIARLTARNCLTREEVQRRVAAQPPLEPKMPFVDEVIDNNGTVEETRGLVVAAWERLRAQNL